MKTPRELLLKRHEAALPKLDALRAAAALPARSQLSTLNSQPASLWERLFGPNPLAWAGLAAVWLVLLAVNRDSNAPKTTDRASQPSEASVAEIVRENRRQMAELLNLDEPQAAATPRNELHPKRSQRRVEVAVV
jgi:hypothetical protein